MTTDEQTLRAHFAARNHQLTDVIARPDLDLGAAYIVKHAGGGGLALVRNGEVITEPSAASIDRLIEVDGAAQVMKIPPAGFLALLQQWKAVPDLGSVPIRVTTDARTAPQWATIDGVPRFVLHAQRKTNAGARPHPTIPMRRAIGTLGAKGLTWELEDVDLPVAE